MIEQEIMAIGMNEWFCFRSKEWAAIRNFFSLEP